MFPRVLVFVMAVLGVLAVSSSTMAAVGPRGAKPSPITAPTATTYTVDGRTVSLVCQGTGSIAVIFQAGGNDPGSRWDQLVAALGPDVLTCVFDRPGVASSEASPTPLTPRGIAKTLAAVLKQAHLGRRVVLVGHSIGGLNSLVFGAAYPKKVAGAVLLDPSVAAFFQASGAEPILESYGYDPAVIYEQINAVQDWPSVPLLVLSRDPEKAIADGSTAELEDIWQVGTKRYAGLSRRGDHTVVPDTTHYVDVDAPETAVDAIRRVLARIK